ncbi:putative GTD-binding domain-containing protein [Lupinus albus]|uniref:Putative GTD-binding domain-containing protein n=1 Tax=Lupinus albus TaxID=3870 RepID=A0A6A4NDS5_LUPAL|nr:putative GTD-binding domain-containing protein [Lupinus albus]
MAETQGDVAAMKETLHAQQQLLQKLCIELDQEREASASAASEALDMILRLQGEKAAVKMEASHYKIMAEEKMDHAEATLEVLEELMYQKEMEIASLEYQVKAYKRKLLRLGCDLNASEFEFPDDLLLNRSDQQDGENRRTVRRLHSLPPLQFNNFLGVARNEDNSTTPFPSPVDDSTNKEVIPVAYGTVDSYLEQIKRFDEKVKVVSDCTEGKKGASLCSKRGRSYSILPQASTKITCDQIDRLPSTNLDKVNHGEDTLHRKEIANGYDVFEVLQTSEKHKVSENVRKRLVKWYSETGNRLRKQKTMSEGTVASQVKHDAEKRNGNFRVHSEIKIPIPNDMMTITGQKKQEMDMDSNAQAEFQALHQRIERLEKERLSRRQEIIRKRDGEELLRLLKAMQSQLTLILSEMKSWKTLKDNVPLAPLQEAMLHFWI